VLHVGWFGRGRLSCVIPDMSRSSWARLAIANLGRCADRQISTLRLLPPVGPQSRLARRGALLAPPRHFGGRSRAGSAGRGRAGCSGPAARRGWPRAPDGCAAPSAEPGRAPRPQILRGAAGAAAARPPDGGRLEAGRPREWRRQSLAAAPASARKTELLGLTEACLPERLKSASSRSRRRSQGGARQLQTTRPGYAGELFLALAGPLSRRIGRQARDTIFARCRARRGALPGGRGAPRAAASCCNELSPRGRAKKADIEPRTRPWRRGAELLPRFSAEGARAAKHVARLLARR